VAISRGGFSKRSPSRGLFDRKSIHSMLAETTQGKACERCWRDSRSRLTRWQRPRSEQILGGGDNLDITPPVTADPRRRVRGKERMARKPSPSDVELPCPFGHACIRTTSASSNRKAQPVSRGYATRHETSSKSQKENQRGEKASDFVRGLDVRTGTST